ncbi:MAG TPA: deoxyribodipyrimidine photo-lyase [Gemmatimonadaceae bacterium]|nr:deoxyribodipyrimidine photo-lyase [Gemmatimonadaceae bacterium]
MTAPHALDGDYVRDQVVARTTEVNGKRTRPEGAWVLYWMQSTQRLHDNWALRAAIRAADKVGKPLVIHQGLDPTYPHASDRHHHHILHAARDTAADAEARGLTYQFVLRRRRDDDRRVLDRLADKAYCVFTDRFPTAGVDARTWRLGERVACRVLAVDGSCIVPSGLLPKAEWAARTIRPKLAKLRDASLEPVEERAPRHALAPDVAQRLHDARAVDALPLRAWRDDEADAAIAREIAACEIDHTVGPVTSFVPGARAAAARLDAFVRTRLAHYTTQRNEAADDITSHLSPDLHYGHVAAAEVVRAALASDAPRADVDAFVDQVLTWRELAYNWCVRTPHFDQLRALPDWIQRTMAAHAGDPREETYDLATLDAADTDDALWNAAQRQLLETGVIHNYARMLWGKQVIRWAPTYEEARAWLFHLNDRYALDGRDPNSVGGIMWCLGLWDRSWGNKPVWGGLRPMLTSRAKLKFDVGRYVRRWSGRGLR